MMKSIKVMLVPNNKQKTKMFQYANASRFIYNWTINKEEENYKNGGKFIYDNVLRKELTKLKKTDEYKWLSNVSSEVIKQSVKDACNSYMKFFNGTSKHPKFKSKKKTKPSFYQDGYKLKFTNTHVKFEGFANNRKLNRQKINWVRLAEQNRVPMNCKYCNPRIKFDGLNWWLTVSINCEENATSCTDEGIGIDLGIKDLAICSNGNIYKNINKTQVVKKIEKRKSRLQRSISKKYYKNKKGQSYCKTNNIIKGEKELLKLNHRLINIRQNHLHQATSEIIKRKPSFICIEDLNVSGMMKNKHLSKAIQQQNLYEFRRQIEYKSAWNGIPVIVADRFFPSSRLCSCCGCIKEDLKLSDRIYICECGNIIDRDFQAALNLKKYGENVLEEQFVCGT